jgi:hypothetical protein
MGGRVESRMEMWCYGIGGQWNAIERLNVVTIIIIEILLFCSILHVLDAIIYGQISRIVMPISFWIHFGVGVK